MCPISQAMQDEIARHRVILERMEVLGKDLIENSNENPWVVADVRGKLTKVRVQIDRFDARIEQRRAILQNILLQIQVYEVMYDEFMVSLAEIEDDFNNVRPISAIYEVVTEQKEDVEHFIAQSIAKRDPVYEKVLEDGQSVLDRMEPGEEKDEQQEKLDNMVTRWTDLKNKTADLQIQIGEVQEASKKYLSKTEPFKVWLDETEKKLDKIKPVSCDKEEVAKSLEELDDVMTDVDAHSPDFEEVSQSAKELIDCCQVDGEVIKADFVDVKHRYENLSADVTKKKGVAEKAKEAVDKYQSALQPVQEAFTQAEDLLASHEPTGTDADKIQDELELVKALVSTIEERKMDIKQLNHSGQELLQEAEEHAPSTIDVKNQLTNTNKKSKDIPTKLKERQRELEKALLDATQFNTTLEKINDWLPETVEIVNALEPVSNDPDKIKEQIKETDQLQEELKRYLVLVMTLDETGQRMIEENMRDPDTVADITNKMDKVRNPVDKICAKLDQRSARLQSAALQSQEFQDSYDDFVARLGTIEECLVSEDAISPLYSTTKRQKEENEDARDSIAQQEPVLEKLLKVGEDILQATEPGEEKDALEHKLGDLKERWEALNKKANQREERLDSVMPEARDYHSEMQVFDPWLSDAERALGELKVDSSIPGDIAKQQRALQDLKVDVEKHKPLRDSLNRTAESLIDKCKDDSHVIEAQIKDENKRWNALLKELQAKEDQLEEAKEAADQFHDALGCVEEAVQKTESALESCEPPGLDATRAKDDLDKVTSALEKLEECEPRRKDMREQGEKLLQTMDDDSTNALILKRQIDNANERFITVFQKAKDRKGQLEKVVVLIIQFVEKYDLVITWIEETTVVVESFVVISANPNVAKSQLEEVEQIQEDVVEHKYMLESVDEVGQHLVECCDNNPSVLMEVSTKISKAKAPLEAIEAKIEDRQAKLQLAVLQTQEFQETLDDFTEKLAKIEDDLAHMLPVSSVYDDLRDQNQELEHTADDVKQLEPVFERVSKNGSEVLESLEPGEERDNLEELLGDIRGRWTDVKDRVANRQSKLGEVTPVAKKYNDALHSLLPWMSDTEEWISSLDPVSCDEKALAKEVKLLANLATGIDEHRPEMDCMNDSARTLSELCDDMPVTQAEVKDVNKRWNMLTGNVSVRLEQVESVKSLMEQLRGKLEPIEENLEKADEILDTPLSYITDPKRSEQELAKIEVRKSGLAVYIYLCFLIKWVTLFRQGIPMNY